jgi:hypothetical protein
MAPTSYSHFRKYCSGRPVSASLTGCLAGPPHIGPRQADCHAQPLAPPVAVDADGDYRGNGHDPPALTQIHARRVDPRGGRGYFDRPVEERPRPLVDLRTGPSDLALGDAGHAHCADQIESDTPGALLNELLGAIVPIVMGFDSPVVSTSQPEGLWTTVRLVLRSASGLPLRKTCRSRRRLHHIPDVNRVVAPAHNRAYCSVAAGQFR